MSLFYCEKGVIFYVHKIKVREVKQYIPMQHVDLKIYKENVL